MHLHHAFTQCVYSRHLSKTKCIIFIFIFLLIERRKHIIYIPSDRKFSIGISARKVRSETLYGFRKRAQHRRMVVAVLYRHGGFTLYVNRADGTEHRVQRSSDIIVRRRNNGTETQRIFGFAGVYGGHARLVNRIRFGILLSRLENRRAAEHAVPVNMRMPCFISRYIIQFFTSFSYPIHQWRNCGGRAGGKDIIFLPIPPGTTIVKSLHLLI